VCLLKTKQAKPYQSTPLVKLTRVYGSETASRYNLFNSIEVNAIPKPGYSSGDAIKAIEETAKEQLPTGFAYEFSGPNP
jgi:HAE1 family hydrophobic/amphiphilic exporter-1